MREFLDGTEPADLLQSKYADWFRQFRDKDKVRDDSYIASITESKRQLALAIRGDGYNPDLWRLDPRKFNPDDSGFGPIACTIGDFGQIMPWDGSHRAAILKALDEDVRARVWTRSARWQELRNFQIKDHYQPYPHPDLSHVKPTRRGVERYIEINKQIGEGPKTICVVGACTGMGARCLNSLGRVVGAIESHRERFLLLEAWNRFDPFCQAINKRVQEVENFRGVHVVVGLSVYHHVATNASTWGEVCKKLADCPVHFMEVAKSSDPQWHSQFRTEAKMLGKSPDELIVHTLQRAGGYTNREVVFRDDRYSGRETIKLSR
jgi:hypothetical protein